MDRRDVGGRLIYLPSDPGPVLAESFLKDVLAGWRRAQLTQNFRAGTADRRIKLIHRMVDFVGSQPSQWSRMVPMNSSHICAGCGTFPTQRFVPISPTSGCFWRTPQTLSTSRTRTAGGCSGPCFAGDHRLHLAFRHELEPNARPSWKRRKDPDRSATDWHLRRADGRDLRGSGLPVNFCNSDTCHYGSQGARL